jgi:hypothetical protein
MHRPLAEALIARRRGCKKVFGWTSSMLPSLQPAKATPDKQMASYEVNREFRVSKRQPAL